MIWEKLVGVLVGFAGHLVGGLKLAASAIFARIMAWLGLTFVSMRYVMPDVKDFLAGYMSALPDQVADLAGAMGVDIFMVLILSAIVARMGMRVFLAGVDQLQQMIGNAGG